MTTNILQDLIEMIVGLQSSVETQARKQSDMEDYIDSLLTKVLSAAPQLLQKNINHDNETQQLNNKNRYCLWVVNFLKLNYMDLKGIFTSMSVNK